MESGEEIKTLTGHDSSINSVCFSPVGVILASAGYNGIIKLWNWKTGTEIKNLKGHTDYI